MNKILIIAISAVIGLCSFAWLCSINWKIALAVGLMLYANNLNNKMDGQGIEGPDQPTDRTE
jgi:hypothetical protein